MDMLCRGCVARAVWVSMVLESWCSACMSWSVDWAGFFATLYGWVVAPTAGLLSSALVAVSNSGFLMHS